MKLSPPGDFWFECQVDSFIRTFNCYCWTQELLHGSLWWV